MNQKCLKYFFNYDPETGAFTWAVDRHSRKKGDMAGTISRGRRYIALYDKQYRSSKMAWLWVYGYIPKRIIKHRNGINTDDSIKNLYLWNKDGSIDKYIKTRFDDLRYNYHDHVWEVIGVGSFDTKFEAIKARMIHKMKDLKNERARRMGQTRRLEVA